MRRGNAARLALTACMCSAFARAEAHHSFASFDATTTSTLHGAIYRVEWTAPHMWIWIKADDGTIWGLEGGAPSQLEHAGYKRGQLDQGTKLSATLHPLHDGRHGGSLIKLTLDTGGQIAGVSPQQAPPAAPPPR